MDNQYALVETGVLNSVRSLTAHFPEDWQVTNDGSKFVLGAYNFLIVKPGAFPFASSQNKTIFEYQWNMSGILYVKFDEYYQSMERFSQVRWDIIDRLKSDPTLGGVKGVYDVNVFSNQDVLFWYEREGSPAPNFITQNLSIVVVQRVVFVRRW